MVTLKEYEAYLKVKRFIDGRDEVEIISRLINESNYVPLIIESDGTDSIKYYSTSATAKDCGVTKQTLDYTYRNRCTRIVRRKGGVKVHIPPLTKFRPETPCGVKRSHAKNFWNRNCGYPTIKLF